EPLADFNRRVAAASAVAATAFLAKMVDLSIWVRDVVVPREARRLALAAATGRTESRARLESLREATAQLPYAARAWYMAAGARGQRVGSSVSSSCSWLRCRA